MDDLFHEFWAKNSQAMMTKQKNSQSTMKYSISFFVKRKCFENIMVWCTNLGPKDNFKGGI